MDQFEVRVSITKLLLVLIIVIVPLSIVGLVLTQHSDKATDNSVGSDFKTIAQMYSNDISETMHDRVAAVRALATDPVIVDAVSQNPKASAAQSAGSGMLASSASQVLRRHRSLDPRYLWITVTDGAGNVVAASQPPSKSSYADDASWQSLYNNGQGAVKISDIVDDVFTKSYYVKIGVPISGAASGATNGVLTAAVGISDLLARFHRGQIGNGAQAELVNDDGAIVSGPNADVFARVKSQEFDALHDQLGSLQGTQSGWQMANLRQGPYIVGFAATGLKEHFDNLGWAVLVSQGEHQAAAPIRSLEHFALAMVILAVFMLTLLCVYYFIHRTQKFEDIESALLSDRNQVDRDRAAAASA